MIEWRGMNFSTINDTQLLWFQLKNYKDYLRYLQQRPEGIKMQRFAGSN